MGDLKAYDYSVIFRQIIQPVTSMVTSILMIVLTVLCAALLYAMMKYRLNIFHLTVPKLRAAPIRFNLFDFARWFLIDEITKKEKGYDFPEFGLTIYCGRQGAGKTISMVHYLNTMHERYPKCLIVTNFDYEYATYHMTDWKDFMEIRNGEDGVIFAIDEIHSEYSSASWKDFPENLLSEISQQRKQRVKIVATSQVFARVAKPIREQCFSTIQCRTFANRWTFNKEYDAYDYEEFAGSTAKSPKLKSIWRTSFVQSDFLRNCYDTYEKIERLRKTEFLPRSER